MDLEVLFRAWVDARRLRGRRRWSRDRLERFQAREIRRVRAAALARSPFYRRHHPADLDTPLDSLPVLTKAMVMANWDDVVTDRALRLDAARGHIASGDQRPFLGRYRLLLTSGTTGEPGVFVVDRSGWFRLAASYARSSVMAGYPLDISRRVRAAAVASTHRASVSNLLATSFASWWVPMLTLDALDAPATLVRRLNAWRPQLIVAYASVARVLAQEQLAGRLDIHPRWVITTGEVLTAETRRLATEAWGAPPFNRYTTSETGDLAAECAEERRLHLAEDTTVVEAVDESSRAVAPGQWSARVLVTPLGNRVQPLIRYELSDQVLLSDRPCPCGRPSRVLEGIRGRVEELIRLPALVGPGRVELHGFVFEYAIDDLPVSGYQVVLEADDRVRVRLEGLRGGFDEAAFRARLATTLREHGARPPDVIVEHVDALERSPRGKTPPIIDRRGPSAPRDAPAP